MCISSIYLQGSLVLSVRNNPSELPFSIKNCRKETTQSKSRRPYQSGLFNGNYPCEYCDMAICFRSLIYRSSCNIVL